MKMNDMYHEKKKVMSVVWCPWFVDFLNTCTKSNVMHLSRNLFVSKDRE